ncbi:hypothetical protein BBJ28_00000965 [Nothophytophthora sp. Chile5]|nr:hypothetical protein BBJ28_00000965 [Nothophytophthora sp. Chile5]
MAHELVSPHCSSWSFSSSFSLSGGGSATATTARSKFGMASTVTVDPLDDDDCDSGNGSRRQARRRGSDTGFYEAARSPIADAGILAVKRSSSSALLANYFAAGVFHGAVPALVYPLFKIHLGLQGYQANAVQTLLDSAWHGKLVLSLLTDCVPICGRRRTPYLYLGWTLVLAVLTLTITLHLNAPLSDASEAPGLILAITTASMGYLLVDAACDGLMVEAAHRESQTQAPGQSQSSGPTQTAVHVVRFIAELLGTLLVAVGLNSSAYGGGFPFEISINALFSTLAIVALLALAVSAWGLQERRTIDSTAIPIGYDLNAKTEGATAPVRAPAVMILASPPSLRAKLVGFWRIMQQRATWQIALFGFLQKACLALGMDSAPHSPAIHEFWLHTDPFTKNLVLALSSGGVCVAASVFVHRCLLSTSWRASVLVALLAGLAVGFPAALAAVFNVCRNKFVFLGAAQIVGFADCVAMVLRMLVVVEIAEPGFESSTYALVTSAYNLADPVAVAFSNALGAHFGVYDRDIADDSADVRLRAGALFAILFGVRVFVSLAALPLLPRQRREARELKANGGANKCAALLLFSALGLAFFLAIGMNLLAVFKSTACLSVAGGPGC